MYLKHKFLKQGISYWNWVMTLLRFGSSRLSGGTMMHFSEFPSVSLPYKTVSNKTQRHVNNVHYVRFFESGRLKWCAVTLAIWWRLAFYTSSCSRLTSLAHALGGPTKVRDIISARGVGLILKWIDVRYRRPVRFPDTVRPSPFFAFPTSFTYTHLIP